MQKAIAAEAEDSSDFSSSDDDESDSDLEDGEECIGQIVNMNEEQEEEEKKGAAAIQETSSVASSSFRSDSSSTYETKAASASLDKRKCLQILKHIIAIKREQAFC